MIKIGIETPAERNKAIYAYDSTQHIWTLGADVDSRLNRYSLTGMTYGDVEDHIPGVVEQLSEEFQLPYCYLTAWQPESFTPAQLRLREKRHLDANWSLTSYNRLRIAVGPDQWRYGGFGVEEFHERKSYCMWVEPSQRNDLIEEGIWNLLCSHCHSRDVAPDLRNAGLLLDKVRALAYVVWRDTARAGFVLVTRKSIRDSFWEREDWGIQQVLTGPKAVTAWWF